MAGLPKRVVAVASSLTIVVLIAFTMAAQDVQSPSDVIDPVIQTPSFILEPVIVTVQSNSLVSEEEKQLLIDTFTAVIEDELMTVDQAVEMLMSLGWTSLELEEDIAVALALLDEILGGVAAGEIEDPVAALIGAYNAEMTPDGITNAISKAGASDATLLQAQTLVASGLPPGIVLRVTKAALRGEEPTQAEIDAMLTLLGDAFADGSSPGQAANAATEQGTYQYEEQEQEQEENANEGENEEPEEEENKNGKKKNDNGNQGQSEKKK